MFRSRTLLRFSIIGCITTLFIGTLGVVFTFAAPVADQTVAVNNFSFTEQDITIEIGDTITWVNEQGRHNVVSTSGPVSFDSGEPQTGEWEFSVTFSQPGVYQYICEPHASSGMFGSITVLESVTEPTDTPTPTVAPTTAPVNTPTATMVVSPEVSPMPSVTKPPPVLSPTPAPTATLTPIPTQVIEPSPSPTLAATLDPTAIDEEIFLPMIYAPGTR